MPLSMYQSAVPVSLRALTNLRAVLVKGHAHAVAHGYDPGVLLQTRLTADMLPLVAQVRIATDMAKNGVARLAGVDPLPFDDNEVTFEELFDRLDRALAYIEGFSAGQIDGSETRAITLKMRSGELHFEGQAYLLHFVIPNLFFHTTTAYAILRQSGVDIGKLDFIGRPE